VSSGMGLSRGRWKVFQFLKKSLASLLSRNVLSYMNSKEIVIERMFRGNDFSLKL
jgi:hypothetical protein